MAASAVAAAADEVVVRKRYSLLRWPGWTAASVCITRPPFENTTVVVEFRDAAGRSYTDEWKVGSYTVRDAEGNATVYNIESVNVSADLSAIESTWIATEFQAAAVTSLETAFGTLTVAELPTTRRRLG